MRRRRQSLSAGSRSRTEIRLRRRIWRALMPRQDKRIRPRKILNELVQLSAKQYVPPLEIALTYLALGRNDEALSGCTKPADERASALVYLKVNQAFDPIRSDPRFQDLELRMHLN